jgi:hypothetical protein
MTLDWSVQLVRLSAFSNGPVAILERDWQIMTGQQEAASRTAIPGGRTFSGKFADGQLALSQNGPRVDVMLFDPGPERAAEPRFPDIGKWSEVSSTFSAAVEKWLSGTEFPIVRVAFGAVLVIETTSRKEALTMLSGLLESVNVDAERMKEMLFIVNWDQESAVHRGARINRITNWTVVRTTQNLMQLAGDKITISDIGRHHALRLEIDHSTSEESVDPMDPSTVIPTFRELLLMARENADKGERP